MKSNFLACMAGIIVSGCIFATQPSTMHPPGYAVASAHPLATNAGLDILAQGGNAFDAAIAVSAALAVVEPYHSGLGGGGFWLLYDAEHRKSVFIDGREVAPMAATRDMFLDKKGNPKPGLSLNGGLSAAIPGEPAALVYIAEHYGRLPLARSLAPAIKLAEQGFPVDHRLHFFLKMGDRTEQLKKYPASSSIFLKKGEPYPIGEQLMQPDLARTLRQLANKGHDGFYRGQVAKSLVRGVNKAGGIWTLNDLSSYEVKVREPLKGRYHDMDIVTAPLPSAGGIALITMLNIVKSYPLQTLPAAQRVHYLVEAMRLAYWQRGAYLADPDFIDVPVKTLLSKQNAKQLRALIKTQKALKSTSLPSVELPEETTSNTTHFSILDNEGNRVAATLTINYIFGSSVVAEGTGVLLNDEMDDFAIKPKVKNVFGIVGSVKNAIEPGKRPLSSMTPTFLEKPGRVAVLGTPGGSRIPTMVLLSTLAFNESYGAIKMVSLMRFHHQYLPDKLMFEPDTFSPDLRKTLSKMGHQLKPLKQYYGDMQAISWDQDLNLITAASDPRHIGMAANIMKDKKSGYGVRY